MEVYSLAALDSGVFYTYIQASDYIIRRSQFSENMAGDDGGVMLIGQLNCYAALMRPSLTSTMQGTGEEWFL